MSDPFAPVAVVAVVVGVGVAVATPGVFPVAAPFTVPVAVFPAVGALAATVGALPAAAAVADAEGTGVAVAGVAGVGGVVDASGAGSVTELPFARELPGGGSRRRRAAMAPSDPRITRPATAPLASRATGRLGATAPPLRPEETGAIVPPKGGGSRTRVAACGE